MELKQAIQRVAKVCPRKKEKAALQAIRFLPAQGENTPPYLFATDGIRSALVKVDIDQLPNVLLPSADVVKAANDPGEMDLKEIGYGKIEFHTPISSYQVQGMNFDGYPTIPPIPSQYTPVMFWEQVSKVFHAAAKPAEVPDLAVVHFTPDYVECTDKSRLVRIEVSGPWDGLVPVTVFQTWPKGDVFTAFTSTHAFFWVGDELRMAVLAHSPDYPKTNQVVPVRHAGPFMLVETQVFRDAIRQGMKLSTLGLVLLEFGEQPVSLKIRAWQEKSEESSYEAEVPVLNSRPGVPGAAESVLLITGKYLDEALKEVDTPNVRVCYGNINDPLRIESGLFRACIWSMVYS